MAAAMAAIAAPIAETDVAIADISMYRVRRRSISARARRWSRLSGRFSISRAMSSAVKSRGSFAINLIFHVPVADLR
jgi:hypothetical protein